MSDHYSSRQNRSQGRWADDHGQSRTRLYKSVWTNMLGRSFRKSCKDWHNYGGRGITVCPEWHDFPTFAAWAQSSGYTDEMTLDRINPDGNYEPGNCRWLTKSEQGRTMRKCIRLTAFGETKTVREWSRDSRCRVHHNSLRFRLRRGWLFESALTIPPSEQHVLNAMGGR